MDTSWNHCLLCSCSSQPKRNRKQTFKKQIGSESLKPSHTILLEYIISGGDKNWEGKKLYKDILQLTRRVERDGDAKVQVKFCVECDKAAEQFLEMKLELEEIQKKMKDKLKTVIEVIIANSRLYGSYTGIKEKFTTFEKMLKGMEERGSNCRVERDFLDVVHRLQTVVFDKDLDRLNISLDSGDEEDLQRGRETPENDFEEEIKMEIEDLEEEIGSSEEEEMEVLSEVKNEEEMEVLSEVKNEEEMEGESGVKSKGAVDLMESNLPKAVAVDPLGSLNVLPAKPTGGSSSLNLFRTILPKPMIIVPQPMFASLTPAKIIICNPATKQTAVQKTVKDNQPSKKPGEWLRHKHFKCELCSFSTGNYCATQQHLRKHEVDGEKTLKCSQCQEKFVHKQSLEHHMYRHSLKNTRKCDVCKKMVQVEECEAHLKTHPQMYSCKYCDFCCGTYNGLIMHTSLPEGVRLTCDLCPVTANNKIEKPTSTKRFSTKVDLMRHLQDKHGYIGLLLKCDYPDCNKEFLYPNTLAYHTDFHTSCGNRRPVCSMCDKSFSNSVNLQMHISRVHHKVKSVQCDLCPERFIYIEGLTSHKIAKHGHEQFKCELCPDKVYTRKTRLQEHIKACHQPKKVPAAVAQSAQCPICQKVLKASSIKSHIKAHSADKNKEKQECVCEFCGFVTNLPKYLNNHMVRLHATSERFKCEYCNKTFPNKAEAEQHEKTRAKEKPFQCEPCGTVFCTKIQLTKHRKEKHSDLDIKDFKCFVCNYATRTNSQLQTHMLLHTGQKPFKCKVCGTAFRIKGQLTRHTKEKHEMSEADRNKKDFKCIVCEFATRTKTSLQIHMLQHGGEKKFQCSQCPKSFLRKSVLLVHERVHTGEKPYKCDPCGTAYAQRCQLLLHNKRNHNAKVGGKS